jgi:ribonuclease R
LARNPGQAFKPRELARRLSMRSDAEYRAIKDVLRLLQESKQVRQERRGKVGHLHVPQRQVGVLQVKKQGLGFVTVQSGGERIFVAPRFLGTAMHGDTVEVSLFAQSINKKKKDSLPEGEITRVLQRARTRIVGTIERIRRAYRVVPDERRIATDIIIAPENLADAQPGDKVVVEIESWGEGHLQPEGRVVELLGKAGEVSAELRSVFHEFQLPVGFPQEVLNDAVSLPAAIPPSEVDRRLDFRERSCFTIDPEDAKDFDDAVSLESLGGGLWRLGVHIADVSYYVREGSVLDKEALTRGTSVYFPNAVIPMLPERLSNDVCSLRPQEDRLTYSVFMDVTPQGMVKEYEIRETVIRSKRRFTYEQVQEILDGNRTGERDDTIVETLRAMHTLSTTLTKKRMKEGSIDFESPEAKFLYDGDGKPIEIIKKIRKDSHRLVEEFMLLANKVVAQHVGISKKEEHPRPFLYRVHDVPNPDKMKELSAFVDTLGFKLHLESGASSRSLQKLLQQIRGSDAENVINEVVLRSMAKAVYAEKNIGHYGLAFDYYTHFTSPIRRYPDLFIHRLLKEYARNIDLAQRDEIRKRLPFIAQQTSDRERVAMEAERAGVKVMQVEYMKRHLGDEFRGIVSGVTHYGLFIKIDDLLTEGMIHVRDLEDDYYGYDEKKYALIGRESGKQYRLGDAVNVKVIRVNTEEREIDFAFVESDAPKPKRKVRHR